MSVQLNEFSQGKYIHVSTNIDQGIELYLFSGPPEASLGAPHSPITTPSISQRWPQPLSWS